MAEHQGTVVIGTRNGVLFVNRALDPKLTVIMDLKSAANNAPAQITMASSAPGAKIYYTDDGRDPTAQSKLYSGPLMPDHACTLKARAYGASGGDAGALTVADFTSGEGQR